jgi:hypothetical protein
MASVDRGLADRVFADLVLAIAVDLGDCYLGELVLSEERQEVVGQIVAVAAGGVGSISKRFSANQSEANSRNRASF